MTTDKSMAVQALTERFEVAARADDGAPGWLAELRREALTRLLCTGLPTRKWEDWRCCDIAAIRDTAWQPPPALDEDLAADLARQFAVPGLDAATVVLLDGRPVPALCDFGDLPRGARIMPLAEALATWGDHLHGLLDAGAGHDRRPFAALNTAFLDDGVFLRVHPGQDCARPVQILHLAHPDSDAAISQPRVLIAAEAGARIQVVEVFAGRAGHYLCNAVSDLHLAAGASIDHCRLQRQAPKALHVDSVQVRQAEGSSYTCHSIALGGSIGRSDLVASLNGEGAACILNGVYMGRGEQVLDNRTSIEHAQPACRSRQVYNGILADQARGVFNGRIHVHPHAQQTDSQQRNRALLLSPDATVNTKPQLEIYADDVKCSHGATIGELDETAVFYLRSRGIPEARARSMLTRAFAAEAVEHLANEPLRQLVDQLLDARFGGGRP